MSTKATIRGVEEDTDELYWIPEDKIDGYRDVSRAFAAFIVLKLVVVVIPCLMRSFSTVS